MKPEKNIDDILDRYITSASTEDVESHCDQVFQQLQSRDRDAAAHARPERHVNWRGIGMTAAAAAIVLAVFIGVWWRTNAPAVLESEGSRRIAYREIVRANAGAGAQLKLADGSRVEMRSQSELSLERADDGVLIRLSKGDVIVNAAKQHGHLYVQTKDVTVSVVGTVFLVKAEAAGSRVAVIEGEVRVQQPGIAEMKLRPGDQVMSKPMEWQPVSEEISWSHSASAHLALLQQSSAASGAAEPREAFDVVSVRPAANPAGTGERGAGGVRRRNPRPAGEPCGSGNEPILDPRRFDASDTTAAALVFWAYGLDCGIGRGSDRLFGFPDWFNNDGFDVLALIPEGTPRYTRDQLWAHDAPKLQKMLQSMLAERFHLVMHSETKEMQVYVLTVAKGGPRYLASRPAKRPAPVTQPGGGTVFPAGFATPEPNGMTMWKEVDDTCCQSVGPGLISGKKKSMSWLVNILGTVTGRLVLDRSGLAGEFNYQLTFDPDRPMPPGFPFDSRTVFAALEQDFGLHLESTKEKVDVWVIDHVEKPSEN